MGRMGELSKPIMTPVGVVYRCFFDTQANALKSSEWAVKLFGGETSAFNVIGPGRKGFYEAAIRFKVPQGAQCLKPRKGADDEWQKSPEHAYVLFDSLETPIALYFHDREFVIKLKSSPPLSAYHAMVMDQ